MEEYRIELTVNNEKIIGAAKAEESLLKFLRRNGFTEVKCGFCTPGMILTAKDYMDKNPLPDRKEIKKAISGNLCRCTGYKKIVDAIYDVAVENYKLEGEIYV